jgi:hypothetical protein
MSPNSSTEPAAAEASMKENPRLTYATGSAGLVISLIFADRNRIIMIRRELPLTVWSDRVNSAGSVGLSVAVVFPGGQSERQPKQV